MNINKLTTDSLLVTGAKNPLSSTVATAFRGRTALFLAADCKILSAELITLTKLSLAEDFTS